MNKFLIIFLFSIASIISTLLISPPPKIAHAQILTQETPTVPFFLFVADNRTRNYELNHLRGENRDVNGLFETLWPIGGIYVFPPAASIMTVSSSNVNDALGGTGCETVDISGLDTNYLPITEQINLNGQTPVSTVNSYFRIQGWGFKCVSAGSSNENEGTLYFGNGAVVGGVPANIFNIVQPTESQSKSAFFTVPENYRGFIIDSSVSAVIAKDTSIQLSIFDGNGLRLSSDRVSITSQYTFEFLGPAPIFERSDVVIDARVEAGGATSDIFGLFNVIFSIR